MDIVTHQQLRTLIEAGTPPCVSIFMPTHREREIRQDPARLKHLLREAEEKLIAGGMRGTLARDLLAPASRLLDDAGFWAKNEHGLAIYIAKGYHRIFRLPIEIEDTAMVNDRFDVKPLLSVLDDRLFYVLALAQNDVRLLECTPHRCERVDLPRDVATSIAEATMAGDGHESSTVRHAGDSSNPASSAGAYHGQMVDIQKKEREDRKFYCRQIDDGVRRVVKDPGAPLLLAGADSTVPTYRQVSEHRNLCREDIHGNAEHVSNEALHDKAVSLLEPTWRRQLAELQEQYGTAYAHRLASDDINQILPAAAQGRVGILFVAPERRRLGKFDAEHLFVDDRSGDEDLVDQATVQTLLTGGQVVVVKPDDVPGKQEVAAIYRYLA